MKPTIYKLTLFVLSFFFFLYAQIQITYEDAQNWSGGKKFYVLNKNNNRIFEIDYAYNVKGQKILFTSLNRLDYVSNSIFIDKGFKTLIIE